MWKPHISPLIQGCSSYAKKNERYGKKIYLYNSGTTIKDLPLYFSSVNSKENKQIAHQECMWICSSSMHIDETDIFLSGMLKVYTRKKTAQTINLISSGWFKTNSKAVRRHLLMVGIDRSMITILYLWHQDQFQS